MICGGVSIRGSYHDVNQDSYDARVLGNDAFAVVSDGLGSKEYSQKGSKALCESVKEIFVKREDMELKSLEELPRLIFDKWISRLEGENPDECCATALACFIRGNMLSIAALGDGYICVLTDSDKTNILFDDKSVHYENETDCLYSQYTPELWRVKKIEFNRLNAVYISSDGIGLMAENEEELGMFVKDFFYGYKDESQCSINKDMRRWISEWTGSDDKTAVYIISEEETL